MTMGPDTKELWQTIIRHLIGIVKALETWMNKQ